MAIPPLSDQTATEANAAYSRFSKVVAIVAPPRSGTTIVTAALSVHSRVLAIYEPWNDNKARVDIRQPMDYAGFVRNFVPAGKPGSVLLVKETATDLHYLSRVEELLDTAPPAVDPHLIVILRNPFHVFLSEVQARREWWGAGDLQLDGATFSRWASRTLKSFRVMARMALDRDALLVSYERFTRDPHAVASLTRALGLEPEPAQAEFEKHLDRAAVRGDNRVAREPNAISDRSVEHRAAEFARLAAELERSPDYLVMRGLQVEFERLATLSLASRSTNLLEMMRHL